MSLRALSREVGITHAAVAHHFGDKAGVLTSIAVDGFKLLAAALDQAFRTTGDFAAVGVAYVRFAMAHPAHFEVMFRPELYRRDHPDVVAAREVARAVLYAGAKTVSDAVGGDDRRAGIAAWAYAHGVASLSVGGNLPDGDDAVDIAQAIMPLLFQQVRSREHWSG